jgi:histidine triad (HIT) family protein
MTTIFSKILQEEVPVSFVYRDDKVSAFLDVQPLNQGHILVIPNQEVISLRELDEETGEHLFRVAHRIAKALWHSSLNCEGINLWLADGEAAQQHVRHLHLHVIPRYKEDNIKWGTSDLNRPLASREELEEIAEIVRSSLVKLEH